MQCYASMCGEGRALRGLRAHGWGVVISRNDRRDPKGLPFWIDPGTYPDFCATPRRPWDERAEGQYEGMLDRWGARADFVVLPDIVAGGLPSLDLSMRWQNRVLSVASLVLIAVQDGMEHEHLAPLVGPNVGIFLGGSTKWKLERMRYWGDFCHERGCYYHVARVNTEKRMAMANAAGAHSIDGSSAVKFSCTIGMLDRASRQQDLLAPARLACAMRAVG